MDKINKANVTVYLKDIKNGKEAEDEVSVLKLWLKLNGEEADIKKLLKDADVLLDSHTYLKYPQLTETEIKTLVVDDKWIKALDSAIQLEIESISHELSARVKQLAERYENPLPQISDMMVKLEAKVDCHLERMGFSWK
jgi:type I restriction enzyme M protein